MSLLFRVLYAAHAKGTHHKLALDALPLLETPDAERWRRLFLKHADGFMTGAKAPDDVFKDFKNPVLHPRDGYWGGAPVAARTWYGNTVAGLEQQNWPDAIHAAGVLSHYVTDAVHPFHTGQSEAESCIHRAFEWSTAKSYDAMKSVAATQPAPDIAIPDRPDWLEEMLRVGATRANGHYEKLIAHYDITRGVVDPPAGIDSIGQSIVGDLIRYASGLYAVVLQRAITEAKVAPPEVSLTIDTVLATLQIPIKLLAKRLDDKADRLQVERMYDELKATGTVEVNLPEDDRAIRELHRQEVLDNRARAVNSNEPGTVATPPGTATPSDAAVLPKLASRLNIARQPSTRFDAPPRDVAASVQRSPTASTNSAAAPRPRLSPTDDIVDAPSIGPRMAERLHPLGLLKVADLLAARPEAIAEALGLSHVTAGTIADWQAQAQLVCAVPGLSGTAAQLLVGAGYRTGEAIAAVGPDKLSADVLSFAASSQGRRLLRDGEPPDIERIKMWGDRARHAKAA